jgi:hypothetical protein
MIPVISPPPSSNKNRATEAQVMAANHGHMYFSVHLQECAACRAEKERRERADHESLMTCLCIMIPIVVLAVALMHDHYAGQRAWLWIPWPGNKARRRQLDEIDGRRMTFYR